MTLDLRRRAVLSLLFCLVVVSACAPQPLTVTREPVTVRLVVADSCESLAESARRGYEADRPWVTVESQVFNTALAEEVLRQGDADIAILSWLWGSAAEGGSPLWTANLARDGIAVIVHPESPLLETGLAELHEIFRGRLQERDGVVLTVVSREEGSGTRAAFESIVLGGEGTTLNAVVMPSSESMKEYVATTPGAIGYLSTRRLVDGAGVRVLSIEGVLPTEEAVHEGRYPLWRQLYLASMGDPTGEARQFSQWLLSGGDSGG